MQALGWQTQRGRVIAPSRRAAPTIERFAARRTVAAIVGLSALAGGVVWAAREQSTTAIVGSSAATWLSGEGKGRVVFVSAGADRPSFAVAIGDAESSGTAAYDIADLGETVLVHDRSTGTVVSIDAASGAELSRVTGAVPSDERAALVKAGQSAYLVDVAAQTAKRIDSAGEPQPAVPVGRGFTDWVGTNDGTLWLLNRADGLSARFDGVTVKHTRFTRPNADLTLTEVGNEPIVLDRETLRVRWLRRSTSQDVPTTPRDVVAGTGGATFAIDGAHVVVQDPDPAADCLALVTPSALACLTPTGLRRFVTFSEVDFQKLPDLTGARLFASADDAVLVWPDRADIAVISWETGAVKVVNRGVPSARPTVGWSGGGPLVIDDPASRNATIVDDGVVTQLDKFSRGLIVISPNGVLADNGFEAGAGDGEISAVVEGAPAGTPAADDNDRPDAPIAAPDRAITRTGRSIVLGVLGNDTDPDGDPISIIAAGPLAPTDGAVTVVDGSVLNYRAPAISVDRTVAFPYSIADVGNFESSATVTVEIIGSGRNTSPAALDDDATTTANRPVDVPVLSNDVDDEGDPLTIAAVGTPEHGTAAIGNDGTVRYEPEPGFVGRDLFSYTIVDGYGGERNARVRVEVTAERTANRPPTAVDDRTATVSGARVRVDALANDDDPDGDPLRIIDVARLSGVKVTIVDGVAIDITPDAAVAGLLEISYTIIDIGGLRDTAIVEVVVQSPASAARDQPPIAVDDRGTSAGNAVTIDVVVNDSDPAGGELAVESVTAPTPGTGSASRVSPRAIQFVPATGFIGATRFTYTVANSAGLTATATVTVQVTAPSGSGPVARDDSITIFAGDTATIAVLANDTHPDGLAFDIVGQPVVRGGTAVTNADNSITFTPPDATPGVHTLSYTIQDVNGARSSANVFVTVQARSSTNRPPIPSDDLVSTAFQTPTTIDVLANDSDPDGGIVSLVSVEAPARGSAAVVGDRVRYTPPTAFSGLVTFNYTVSDSQGATATAAITVQVIDRVKVAPIATDDLVTALVGSIVTFDPLSNDLDPDGSAASLTIGQLGTPVPAGGPTATLVNGGIRVAAGGTVGRFEMAYTAVDADGLSAIGGITIVVQLPANLPPQATNDAINMLAVPTTIDVLANDTDPDGGSISISAIGPLSPATAGVATIRPSGTAIDLVPTPGFAGEITFGYTIRDDRNATSSAQVVATVSACPATPALTNVFATTAFNTAVTVALFAGPVPDGSITVGTPSSGSASLNATNGTVLYTPASGFNGVATFSFSVRTICNATATATASVTVNRAPTANDDSYSITNNRPLTLDVLANDTDPDLDALRLVSISNPVGGVANIQLGSIEFTPQGGFSGTASFRYTIEDVGGLQDVGLVTIAVRNAPPTASADSGSTVSLIASVEVDVIANDTDPNGDTLSLASLGAISPAAAGTASISGNRIVFNPASGVGPGIVTIGYTVSDGQFSDTATLTITVVNQPPIAVDESGSIDTATESSVTIDVLANDSDPDGSNGGLTLEYAVVLPSQGVATTSGRLLTFTPAPGTSPATVLINYTISDPYGGQSQGTLTIAVL
jgi:hypothetical protein